MTETPGRAPAHPGDALKAERAFTLGRRSLLVACLALLAVALGVFTHVPLETTLSYNRLSNDFRVPVFGLLLIPGLFAFAWFRGRKQDLSAIVPAERLVIYIVYPVMIAAFTWAQITLAIECLNEGR